MTFINKMTREQRKGIKKDEYPRNKKLEGTFGNRKGRSSKKDKAKNKDERIKQW